MRWLCDTFFFIKPAFELLLQCSVDWLMTRSVNILTSAVKKAFLLTYVMSPNWRWVQRSGLVNRSPAACWDICVIVCVCVCCSSETCRYCHEWLVVLCCCLLDLRHSLTCVVSLSRWWRPWQTAALVQQQQLVTVLQDWQCPHHLTHRPYLVHDLHPTCLLLSHIHRQSGCQNSKMTQC